MRANVPASIVLIVAIAVSATHAYAQAKNAKGKAIEAVVKILTGAAASESLRRSGQNYVEHKQADELAERLRQQGASSEENAVYSIYFTLDGDSSSVYWADVFNSPDVFFAIDFDGVGTSIVPQIRNEWTGGPILDKIIASDVAPGSTVIVRVMDDDSWSDEVWNTVLRTRVNFRLDAQTIATRPIGAVATVNGQFQLYNPNRQLVIDAPDYIAFAQFKVPASQDGRWVCDGTLYDGNNRKVGTIQVAKLWTALKEAEAKSSESFGWMIFWGVVGTLALLWFLSTLRTKGAAKENANESK